MKVWFNVLLINNILFIGVYIILKPYYLSGHGFYLVFFIFIVKQIPSSDIYLIFSNHTNGTGNVNLTSI